MIRLDICLKLSIYYDHLRFDKEALRLLIESPIAFAFFVSGL